MDHTFDIQVAEEFGVIEAIIIRNFQFWIIKNKANKKHFHEDRTWTYNSIPAFTGIFPYLTPDQVRYAIDKLIEKGVLLKGNYNEKQYDRTLWYCFADETKWLAEYERMLRKRENLPIGENPPMEAGKSPDGENSSNSTDSKPYILSAYLLKKIKERNPEHKEPNLQSWSKEVEKMIRLDKRNEKEIAEIIQWCQNNSFWRNNILSTTKLREKYDQLKLQRQEELSRKGGNGNQKGKFDKEKYTRLLGDEKGET